MDKYKFMSVFAPYMQRFVDAKEAVGFSRKIFLKATWDCLTGSSSRKRYRPLSSLAH